MLEKYFSAPKTLRRLRGGISGPHIDGFAHHLEREGYAPSSAVRYIRAAAHLGCFVQRKSGGLADIDLSTLASFSQHLRRCRCPHFKRGKISYHAHFGVKLFRQHLVGCGICASEPVQDAPDTPVLVSAFRDWFQTHRGARSQLSGSNARSRGTTPDARRGCRPVESASLTRLSSETRQPRWRSDNAKADYLPSGVFAVSQLPRRNPR